MRCGLPSGMSFTKSSTAPAAESCKKYMRHSWKQQAQRPWGEILDSNVREQIKLCVSLLMIDHNEEECQLQFPSYPSPPNLPPPPPHATHAHIDQKIIKQVPEDFYSFAQITSAVCDLNLLWICVNIVLKTLKCQIVVFSPTHLSKPYLWYKNGGQNGGCLPAFHNFSCCTWALSWFAMVDWVQRCCTELFYTFSLDNFYRSFTHATGRFAHSII